MHQYIQNIFSPVTIGEALTLLKKYHNGAQFIAGGTDLMLKNRSKSNILINVQQLGLDYIRRDQGCFRIGSATRITTLQHSPLTKKLGHGLLARIASTWGSPQVANAATIGGNLVSGATADMAPALLAMDAVAVLQEQRQRRVPLTKFWNEKGNTVMRHELLVEIDVPIPRPQVNWSWEKFTAPGDFIPIVNVAVALLCNKEGICTWARVAIGAISAVPSRLFAVEQKLVGTRIRRINPFKLIEPELAYSIKPISDMRASSEYRFALSQTLIARAIEKTAHQRQ
jgi:carbon-monoxide dehydrogenase medium subunit